MVDFEDFLLLLKSFLEVMS